MSFAHPLLYETKIMVSLEFQQMKHSVMLVCPAINTLKVISNIAYIYVHRIRLPCVNMTTVYSK
jgi:hypothetical protein